MGKENIISKSTQEDYLLVGYYSKVNIISKSTQEDYLRVGYYSKENIISKSTQEDYLLVGYYISCTPHRSVRITLAAYPVLLTFHLQ
jgi:hypothetical protein